MRLSKIEGNLYRDHVRLNDPNDECYFFGEYTAKKNWSYGKTNSFISNFKKKPTTLAAKPNLRRWKNEAINTARSLITPYHDSDPFRNSLWIPAPNSKTHAHQDYDRRLSSVLSDMAARFPETFRWEEVIVPTCDRSSMSEGGPRLTPDQIQEIIRIDNVEILDQFSDVVIFDDVITNGATFVATKNTLLSAQPNLNVRGVFLARTVHVIDTSGFLPLE